MYSELALGPEIAGALNSLASDHKTAMSAARRFEIMEKWGARDLDRGRHFNLIDKDGYRPVGDDERGSSIEEQDSRMMFAVNIYGARKDKICAAGSRETGGIEFFSKRGANPVDVAFADEATKYSKIWTHVTGGKPLAESIWGRFYTDGSALLYTRSEADQQRWGMGEDKKPAINEITSVCGALERSCPIYVNELSEMGWVRIVAGDYSQNTLKARFPWIEEKLGTDTSVLDSYDNLERTARMAVKSGTRYGLTASNARPQIHVWLRPSEFMGVKKELRVTLGELFPKGVEIVYAGSVMAFARNAAISESIEIVHSRVGDGQNRRAIGSNTIPVQKVLNRSISLFNRIVTASIPRKYGDPERINVSAANDGRNEDEKIIPMLSGSQTPEPIYIEQIPQQNSQLMDFITALRDNWPSEMDGATPTMFGLGDSDTLGESLMNRDQALQVFGTPYSACGVGMAKACEQAVMWAARNRPTIINGMVPGRGNVSVDLTRPAGQVYGWPEASGGVPESETDVQARMLELIEQSPTIPLYASMLQFPKNLPAFKNLLRLRGLEVPGADSVERQLENIEKLKMSAPQPNPAFLQAQSALQGMEQELQANPDATPEMQQGLQVAQQKLSQTPQEFSSLPVAQDASENHQIASAIDIWWMNTSEGRKFKLGNSQMQAGYKNVYLDWQAHDAMAKKLAPPPPPEVKPGLTLAVDKIASPTVQAQLISQEYGVDVNPQDLTPDATQMPHEITTTKKGVDEQGVPVEQKISISPGGKIQ